MLGCHSKQYVIELDPIALRRYGLTLHDVVERVARNNANFGGGYIEHAEQHIRFAGWAGHHGPADFESHRALAHTAHSSGARCRQNQRLSAASYGATLRETEEAVSATVIALKERTGAL